MKSVDDEVSSTAMSEENSDDMLDELTIQNLTEERRLKVELEREERKCANVKVRIENIQQQSVNVEDSISLLRKILTDSQSEITEIDQEIRSQKQVIDDVCCSDRRKNFCDVMEAVSRVANEYKRFKALVNKEIQKCNSYHAEIDEVKDEALNTINSIIALQNEQQHLINRVEFTVAKLKTYLDVVSNERILLFEKEFERYLALKNFALLTLETEKRNAKERIEQNMQQQEAVRTHIKDGWLSRFDECESQWQNGIDDLCVEDQLVLDHVEELVAADTDEYDQIQLTLNNLKSLLNSMREYKRTLEKQEQLHVKEVTLRDHQVELEKQEVKLKQDMRKILEDEGGYEEDAIQILQYERDALEERVSEIGRDIKTLVEETLAQEMKLESLSHLIDEDIRRLENRCDTLKREGENSSGKLANFRSEDESLEIIEKYIKLEADGNEERLHTDTDSVKELERAKCEMENRLTRELEENDQVISSFQKYVDAYETIINELESLLKMLKKESHFTKEAYSTKQFEAWTLRRDNEQKRSDHNELSKKFVAENSNLERTRDLLQNLEKNSVPKSELPNHPLFQVYKKELGGLDAARKKREKLDQEKKLVSGKLEKYEYIKYKTPAQSQNRSQI